MYRLFELLLFMGLSHLQTYTIPILVVYFLQPLSRRLSLYEMY